MDRAELLTPFASAAAKVRIGNDVWIGEAVRIKEGVSIGNGAIIAADALVIRNVAPFTVVGGVPARVIRTRFDPAIARVFSQLECWQYAVSDLVSLQPDQPVLFAADLEAAVAKGHLEPLAEDRFVFRDFLGTHAVR